LSKKPDKTNDYSEELGDEVIQRQIQEVYQEGTIDEQGAQHGYSKSPGSVKGNKKTDGPNYPAT